jgi:4-hydroxy-3-polyprenylbenzoate decarboxylase
MTTTPNPVRLIIGMTGATGAIIGIRLLQALQRPDIETHLVISKWAQQTIEHETEFTTKQVKALADKVYSPGDMGAVIASGSYKTDGMIVAPCSVRSLSAISVGVGDHLIHRAADVILKERRKLVLVVRETPLHEMHLENMLRLSRMGAVILPPMVAFYDHPSSLEDVVDHIIYRILDQFDISTEPAKRWDGDLKKC